MEKKLKITVFTPAYNRTHTIHRAFESLKKQTIKDFEWLIVDDGSTDGLKEVVEQYKTEADFNIRYYYKENGGKHTAWNMACPLINTEYFICLDSDDALVDNALERMLLRWSELPEEKKQDYWCVVGLDVDARTGEIIGDKFPDGINQSENPKKIAATVKGDKIGVLSTQILKQFPFPEPEGTTFITESIVWNKIDGIYKQYYVNESFALVYRNEPDSLTLAWYRDHVEEGYVSNYFWMVSNLNDVGISSSSDWKLVFRVAYYGLMANKKIGTILSDIEKPLHKAAVTAMTLPAYAMTLTRGKKHKKN